jgi:hypothetical protein
MTGVRFSTGRMMIAVAIIGVLLATFEAGRRWERVSSSTPVGVTIRSQPYLYDDVVSGVPSPGSSVR